jgi:hypothetical protein
VILLSLIEVKAAPPILEANDNRLQKNQTGLMFQKEVNSKLEFGQIFNNF